MNVVIIDDEPLAISIVEEYLKDYAVTVLARCNNGFEALKAIKEHRPDLIFLDIQMPKINGFELLELLDEKPKVIFTTAFDEFALKAFEHQASDYLLKPFTKERFAKAMSSVSTQNFSRVEASANEYQQSQNLNRIVLKDGSDIKIIPIKDVVYLEAYDDYVKIHTENNTFLKKYTLSKFEDQLSTVRFVRIHRSFIINLNYLKQVEQLNKDSHRAIMNTDDKLAISRSGYSLLKHNLGI